MTPGNDERAAADLSAQWDALVSGSAPDHSDLLDTILRIHAADDTPPPSLDLRAAMWASVLAAETTSLVPPAAVIASQNGHAKAHAPYLSTFAAPLPNRWTKVAVAYRAIAVAVIAGLFAGFVAGIGSRLVMRLSGLLTIDQNHGLLTDNDAPVGVITFGGTFVLGILGAAAGIAGALIYLAVRSLLPGSGWRRGVIFGGGLLAVFGFVVMDPHNPDYRLFGPVWLNIGAFSSIYVIFGLCFVPIHDRLDRRIPHLDRQRASNVMISLVLLPFVVLPTLGLIAAGTTLALDPIDAPTLIFGLILLLPLLRCALERLPGDALERLPPMPRVAAVAIPGVAGLLLTLRAIVDILRG